MDCLKNRKYDIGDRDAGLPILIERIQINDRGTRGTGGNDTEGIQQYAVVFPDLFLADAGLGREQI